MHACVSPVVPGAVWLHRLWLLGAADLAAGRRRGVPGSTLHRNGRLYAAAWSWGIPRAGRPPAVGGVRPGSQAGFPDPARLGDSRLLSAHLSSVRSRPEA